MHSEQMSIIKLLASHVSKLQFLRENVQNVARAQVKEVVEDKGTGIPDKSECYAWWTDASCHQGK